MGIESSRDDVQITRKQMFARSLNSLTVKSQIGPRDAASLDSFGTCLNGGRHIEDDDGGGVVSSVVERL